MEKTSKCCLLVTLVFSFLERHEPSILCFIHVHPLPFLQSLLTTVISSEIAAFNIPPHTICHISLVQNYRHPAFFFARRLFVFSIHSPLWQILSFCEYHKINYVMVLDTKNSILIFWFYYIPTNKQVKLDHTFSFNIFRLRHLFGVNKIVSNILELHVTLIVSNTSTPCPSKLRHYSTF